MKIVSPTRRLRDARVPVLTEVIELLEGPVRPRAEAPPVEARRCVPVLTEVVETAPRGQRRAA